VSIHVEGSLNCILCDETNVGLPTCMKFGGVQDQHNAASAVSIVTHYHKSEYHCLLQYYFRGSTDSTENINCMLSAMKFENRPISNSWSLSPIHCTTGMSLQQGLPYLYSGKPIHESTLSLQDQLDSIPVQAIQASTVLATCAH
jgi:hypothetical protein